MPCKLKRRGLDVVAGDEVRIELSAGDDEWSMVERLPRRNVLCRSDSRGRSESLASNLDQLGVVVAPRPACDPFIVDRYLAGARYAGIDSLLIVNKQDLPAEAGDLSFVEPYRALGLTVVTVSARTKAGLEALVGHLAGRRSLLAGQSGVGKSSLLNALAGEAVRAIGQLSEGSGEGRHTTVSSAILRTSWGEIADSPGVRDYAPPVVPEKDVQLGFVEIAALAQGCRFLDCLHLRELQCAVQAAVVGDARWGAAVGTKCALPLTWNGRIDSSRKAPPRARPADRPLRSGRHESLRRPRTQRRVTSRLWNWIKGYVHPSMESVTVDLHGPVEELRAFLPLVLPACYTAGADITLAPATLADVRVEGDDLVIDVALASPDPPAGVPAPEPPLDVHEVEQWDAFLTFVVKRAALDAAAASSPANAPSAPPT